MPCGVICDLPMETLYTVSHLLITHGIFSHYCICHIVPKAPGDIYLIEATPTTLDIGWRPAENFVGEYEIFYENGGLFGPFSRSPQDRRFDLEDLQPDTEYEFRIVNTVGGDEDEDELKTDSAPSIARFTTSKYLFV